MPHKNIEKILFESLTCILSKLSPDLDILYISIYTRLPPNSGMCFAFSILWEKAPKKNKNIFSLKTIFPREFSNFCNVEHFLFLAENTSKRGLKSFVWKKTILDVSYGNFPTVGEFEKKKFPEKPISFL